MLKYEWTDDPRVRRSAPWRLIAIDGVILELTRFETCQRLSDAHPLARELSEGEVVDEHSPDIEEIEGEEDEDGEHDDELDQRAASFVLPSEPGGKEK